MAEFVRQPSPACQAEAYYAERALSAEQIAAGLASGTLIRETRIRDALRQLDPALVEAE